MAIATDFCRLPLKLYVYLQEKERERHRKRDAQTNAHGKHNEDDALLSEQRLALFFSQALRRRRQNHAKAHNQPTILQLLRLFQL